MLISIIPKGEITLVYFLDGATNTGKDILENPDLFSCEYTGKIVKNGSVMYKFQWTFSNQQKGYISILVKDDKIDISSMIGVDGDSLKIDGFGRPLGLYNDSSLYELFRELLQSHCNVTVSGTCSDN